MDKEIFERFLYQIVQLVNDENFVITGGIEAVFNDSIAFYTDGKTKF